MQDQQAGPAGTGGTGHPFSPMPDPSLTGEPQQTESVSHAAYDAFYRANGAERAAQLAKALGWFSIGLGVAQVLAPRGVSRAIGVQQHPGVLRAIGAREIVNGIGILRRRRQAGWMWTRVAGDAMDLALLGMAARSAHNRQRRLGLATAAVAGVAVLDLISSVQTAERERIEQGLPPGTEVHIVKSITVNRPAEECYRSWRDFEGLPRFMRHLESVRITGDNRMRWKAKGPVGLSVEWDAELTADEPGQYLAWRSIQGSEVDNSGTVHFERAPGGRGTIMRVDMRYSPPGGRAGALVAKLFGEEPAQQIDEDLRRFKWLLETGEIPTTVGQPSGVRGAWNRLLFRKGAPG